MYLFMIMLAVCLAAFWLWQVVTLMQMSDAAFPGRLDKLTWGIILAVTSVLGAFAFFIWKNTVKTDRQIDAIASHISHIVRETQ